MAHLIHNPHQWSKKEKKSTKLNQSLIVGDMGEKGNINILYIGRDTPTPTTHGSTTRTYMHLNFSKNISLIPLWLDDQMFKRRHLNINIFFIISLNTTTMSSTYSPTASVHDYPSSTISSWNASQKDHQLPPILILPPPACVMTPFLDQTMFHSPPPAIHYPKWLPTPKLITRACHQEHCSQSAAHVALIAQTSQLMGWCLTDAI